MFTIPPVLTVKDYVSILRYNKSKPIPQLWSSTDAKAYWLSKSAWSLRVIIDWYFSKVNKEKINLWVPDYFCYETLNMAQNDEIQIIYYPIKEDFNPDWNACKEYALTQPPAIFVFVHYFGKYLPIDRARVFCNNYDNCLLIEDCAHVLYAEGKFGKIGDFSIFSPHKHLALPDGSVLNVNKGSNLLTKIGMDDVIRGIEETIKKNDNGKKKTFKTLIWLIKRTLQNFLRRKPSITKTPVSNHYQFPSINQSYISKALLSGYNVERIKLIKNMRIHNAKLANYLIEDKHPEIACVNGDMITAPYLSCYRCADNNNLDAHKEALIKRGIWVLSWPDMPPDVITNYDFHKTAIDLSTNLFFLPIHQTIGMKDIIERFDVDLSDHLENDITLEQIFNYEEWENLFCSMEFTHLTQDWAYGDAKKHISGWTPRRYKIFRNNQMIGLMQILEKNLFGIKIHRVNRGPIFTSCVSEDEKCKVIISLGKKYSFLKSKILALSPSICYNENNIFYIYKEKHIFTSNNANPYSSAFIDVSIDLDTIRKGIASKWRNQLVSSEKSGIVLDVSDCVSKETVELYHIFKIQKKMKGIDTRLIEFLSDQKRLVLLSAKCGNEMIAFVILIKHGNSATYLVNWSNEEGRKKYATNFLLWNSIVYLHVNNIRFFDLGGIDDVYTESIAEFKRGLGGSSYTLIGDFYVL